MFSSSDSAIKLEIYFWTVDQCVTYYMSIKHFYGFLVSLCSARKFALFFTLVNYVDAVWTAVWRLNLSLKDRKKNRHSFGWEINFKIKNFQTKMGKYMAIFSMKLAQKVVYWKQMTWIWPQNASSDWSIWMALQIVN